ncbi:UPF0271 protein [bacterium A37T11]|nr:UPF0271 protein [bacterium A37T11]
MEMTIDLNCDMGEAFGNYKMPNDEALLDIVTSASIACGFHAGDPQIMQQTVQLALNKGVAIGAHPGLPDLQGFGRREMHVSPREVYQITLYQIGALHAFVKAAGGRLRHVKAHGALYNMTAKRVLLADALVQAILDFDPGLMLYGLAGSELVKIADSRGVFTVSEVFADRSYQNDGTLTPRIQSEAIINDKQQAVHQVLTMLKEEQVRSITHQPVPIRAETICLHSDGSDALGFAKLIKDSLEREGIRLRNPRKPSSLLT